MPRHRAEEWRVHLVEIDQIGADEAVPRAAQRGWQILRFLLLLPIERMALHIEDLLAILGRSEPALIAQHVAQKPRLAALAVGRDYVRAALRQL